MKTFYLPCPHRNQEEPNHHPQTDSQCSQGILWMQFELVYMQCQWHQWPTCTYTISKNNFINYISMINKYTINLLFLNKLITDKHKSRWTWVCRWWLSLNRRWKWWWRWWLPIRAEKRRWVFEWSKLPAVEPPWMVVVPLINYLFF